MACDNKIPKKRAKKTRKNLPRASRGRAGFGNVKSGRKSDSVSRRRVGNAFCCENFTCGSSQQTAKRSAKRVANRTGMRKLTTKRYIFAVRMALKELLTFRFRFRSGTRRIVECGELFLYIKEHHQHLGIKLPSDCPSERTVSRMIGPKEKRKRERRDPIPNCPDNRPTRVWQ